MKSNTNEIILQVLREHGAPLHTELIYQIAQARYNYVGNLSSMYRQCARLAKQGKLIAIRPAVYATWGYHV